MLMYIYCTESMVYLIILIHRRDNICYRTDDENYGCLNIQSDSVKAKLFTNPLETVNLSLNINIFYLLNTRCSCR